jgi:hypothetical protein
MAWWLQLVAVLDRSSSRASMRLAIPCSTFIAVCLVTCTHRAPPPTPAPTTSLALRVVDSSHAGEPLLAVRLRLIGPQPRQDTVACSDSTRQAVLWVAHLQPGRYGLALNRVGFESRTVLIDAAANRSDTVTVGMRTSTRDLTDPVRTGPSVARCDGRRGAH